MNWKEFFKPKLGKVIIFLLLILIFGIPVTTSSCSTFPLMPGQTPLPCVEKFGFQNLFFIILETFGTTMDAYTRFSVNLITLGYLVLVYLLISAIFYSIDRKKRS
jgi:hypothetical protein